MYDIIIGRNESDKKLFGDKGLILLGKGYVKMGQYTSLSNKIFMDIARSHVILVTGKRGSGKSYTLGVIAEELSNLQKEVSQNISSLIFDTMGIFWTMRFKNEKDRELLQEWGLKGKNLPVKIFVPYGFYDSYLEKGIPADNIFSLDISELSVGEWSMVFNLQMTDPISILIERTIASLKKSGRFNTEDIISSIEKNTKASLEIKNAAISLFEAADLWGIFSKDSKPTQIKELVIPGNTTVIDLSAYSSIGNFNVRALVISLVSKKIFSQRAEKRKIEEIRAISKPFETQEKKQYPLVWIFIDEVHEFLKAGEKTPATDTLIQLLREGRQPGISLVLATQQPGQIFKDVLTQSDIIISHRVTSQPDIESLNYMMQSYLSEDIKKHLNDLPDLTGSAIILDDNSERIYPMRIRPRFTWHGGEAPTAVKVERGI